MSQPSKSVAAYLKAAAKILRLQKMPSQPKGSKPKPKPKEPSTIPSSSRTSMDPSFQHTNGRRLSYSQCLSQHHCRSEHLESPLYALQRRQNSTASSTPPNHSKAAPCALTAKHHYRRSGPPSVFSVTIHHSQYPSPSSAHASLARSQSMPTPYKKRYQHPPNALRLDRQSDLRSSVISSITVAVAPTTSRALTTHSLGAVARHPTKMSAKDLNCRVRTQVHSGSISPTVCMSGDSRTLRSVSRTDSTMSVQSQLSEASTLSIAITANGLPSMDAMKDQVDRSLAADSEAQLVENMHVGLPHMSFVDRRLIVEPCSATIETWVN
ncbi:MAG: hypothetical protein J3Q66DRAFT_395592 [Benniella sp.]|nr:MAG: hypothetical protein J3Q66DRAFT_395592 [Benniella sp.]